MTTKDPLAELAPRSPHAAATPKGALQRWLRAETRPWHERIEKVVPLLRPDLDRPRYLRYVEALAGYYRPLEARLGAVEGWASIGLDFPRRRKVPLIERDLRALGVGDSTLETARALPGTATLARAAGCMYVLEGSTLGSRILARHLRAALGLGEDDGAAFFHGYGDATGAMWESFVGALDALSEGGAEASEVIDAATETFETLESWLRSREQG